MNKINEAHLVNLKLALIQVEARFEKEGEVKNDPVAFALRFSLPRDQEIIAFISALFSYGRVAQIQKTLEVILTLLGPKPSQMLKKTSGFEWDQKIPSDFRHRFNNALDLKILFTWIGEILRQYGSLEDFFIVNKGESLEAALENFVDRIFKTPCEPYFPKKTQLEIGRGLKFLLPRPSRKSACKRLLLFLRWVAGSGPMDLGLWKNFDKSLLLIPVDTHVLRISQHLGLTKRKDASLATSKDITEKLKLLDPHDPTRFDFAICHLGISQSCPSRYDRVICQTCMMNHVCVTFKKRSLKMNSKNSANS